MKALVSTLVCVFLWAAQAGSAQVLRGTVRSASTGEPVPRARVELLATSTATLTGDDGSFELPVAGEGPFTVVVALPGYRVERVTVPALPAPPLAITLAPVISLVDGIEVTASRAREGVDPASFTNLSAQRVAEHYWAQDPAVLIADLAPGVYAYNDNGHGIGYSYFTIRGFSQARSRVTINGAPLNDAESGELFFIDLADFLATAGDIQVQRGVFGLSGIGGAVDFTTAPPAVEPSFTLSSGVGSFATRRFAAVYNSGLVDGTWALTARYSKITSDGYRHQSWVDMWNYFISLARFGQRSSFRFNLFGGPERTHLAYYGVPKAVLEGGLTGNADQDRRFNPLTYPGEIDNFTQPHLQLVHEAALSARTQLSQTLYYFQGEGYFDQFKTNRRLVEYNLPNVTLPDGTVIRRTDLVRRRTVDEWDAGWVPTLRHTVGAWSWTLRGEARLHRAHHFGQVTWAAFYPPVEPNRRYYDYQVEKRSAAVAGLGSWHATETVTLVGGLQLTSHRYRMQEDRIKGVAFTERYDFVLPRAGLVVALAPGAEAYAQVARGGREPAFRTIYDPQDYWGTKVSLEPERVWDAEAGISLRRRSWRLRGNFFFMRFGNEIVWAGALDDNGVPVWGNGARSRHRGFEMDGAWEPSDRFALEGTVTLSRHTFDRYREFAFDGTAEVFDGNRIAGFPDLLASLGARLTTGFARWRLTLRHVGRFYLDNSEDNRRYPERRDVGDYVPLANPAFTLVDLQVGAAVPATLAQALGLQGLRVELRVGNLLDRRYTSFGYVDGGEPYFIPAAGRNVFGGLTLNL